MIEVLFLWTASIYSYYSLFKGAVFSITRKVICTKFFASLKRRYPPQQIAGVLELALVATSHVFFVFFLLALLNISPSALGFSEFKFHYLVYGILLGVAEMGCATLLCYIIIQGLQKLIPDKVPQNPSEWIAIARGGWIKHHVQSFELLPFMAALAILFLQVGSEEVIFRSIIPYSLKSYGPFFSCGIATLFFVWMQAFHTPNWKTAIFPMIGALVMGIVHSYLFYSLPTLIPLIIAHVTFFLMSLV